MAAHKKQMPFVAGRSGAGFRQEGREQLPPVVFRVSAEWIQLGN